MQVSCTKFTKINLHACENIVIQWTVLTMTPPITLLTEMTKKKKKLQQLITHTKTEQKIKMNENLTDNYYLHERSKQLQKVQT